MTPTPDELQACRHWNIKPVQNDERSVECILCSDCGQRAYFTLPADSAGCIGFLKEAVWQVLDDMNIFGHYDYPANPACCIAAMEQLKEAWDKMGWKESDDDSPAPAPTKRESSEQYLAVANAIKKAADDLETMITDIEASDYAEAAIKAIFGAKT